MRMIFKIQRALAHFGSGEALDLLTSSDGSVCQQVPQDWFDDLFSTGQAKVYFEGDVLPNGNITLRRTLNNQSW